MRSDVNVGPLSLSGDLDSVGEGRGGSLSPARTAVLGDMLVLQVSQVVNSVDVVPNPVVRERLALNGSLYY